MYALYIEKHNITHTELWNQLTLALSLLSVYVFMWAFRQKSRVCVSLPCERLLVCVIPLVHTHYSQKIPHLWLEILPHTHCAFISSVTFFFFSQWNRDFYLRALWPTVESETVIWWGAELPPGTRFKGQQGQVSTSETLTPFLCSLRWSNLIRPLAFVSVYTLESPWLVTLSYPHMHSDAFSSWFTK